MWTLFTIVGLLLIRNPRIYTQAYYHATCTYGVASFFIVFFLYYDIM